MQQLARVLMNEGGDYVVSYPVPREHKGKTFVEEEVVVCHEEEDILSQLKLAQEAKVKLRELRQRGALVT